MKINIHFLRSNGFGFKKINDTQLLDVDERVDEEYNFFEL